MTHIPTPTALAPLGELPVPGDERRVAAHALAPASRWRHGPTGTAAVAGAVSGDPWLSAMRLGGTAVILIGAVALVGWLGGTRVLSAVRLDYIPVAPNTAVLFLLLGACICTLSTGHSRLAELTRVPLALSAFVAGTRLAEYMSGADVGVDHWIFSFPSEHLGLAPVGKMAFFTALTFVPASVALFLLTFPERRRSADDLVRALALMVTLIGLVFTLGYVYGSPLLYGGRAVPMALPTAVGFVVLGLSTMVPPILRDRAQRRAADWALRDARDRLELRVAERTAELQTANRELADALAEKRRAEEARLTVEKALRRRAEHMAFSAEIGLAVAEAPVLQEMLERCATIMVKHFDAALARVWLLDDEDDRVLVLRASVGTGTNLDGAPTRVNVGELQIGRIAAERQPYVSDDVVNDPRTVNKEWARREGIVAFAGHPLVSDGRLVGVVAVMARHVLGEGTLDALQAVADRIATAIARKEVEDDLKRSEEQLRQAQKMEAIGQLAGGIAHDFNNMLTAIKSYAELLLGDEKLRVDQKADLDEIRRAADRAAALTRQLLAFSRRQVMQLRVTDLTLVVHELEGMLRRLLVGQVELVISLAPDLGLVKVDPTQIEQVLMNLVVNARDAMPDGGRLTIEAANVDLDDAYLRTHSMAQRGPHVMLAVSDTGHGMDEATRRRAFEPFFTTKERGGGTGLGLSTVYGIVKQSGGHLWVYSEVGHGTVFRIYLPRVNEAAEPLNQPTAPVELSGGSETILMVDDEEPVRRPLRKILERSGYTVLEAASGAEALRHCAEHPGEIHLVITDMMMPGMHGRDLMERIASTRPGAQVLFTSGYADDQIISRGLLDPGVAFIQKPFTLVDLLRKVREVLQGAGTARRIGGSPTP